MLRRRRRDPVVADLALRVGELERQVAELLEARVDDDRDERNAAAADRLEAAMAARRRATR